MQQQTEARRLVDAAQTEAQFQAQILDLAEANGWWVYHVHDSRRSKPGFPDLMLMRGATLIFLEVKSKKGRVSWDQERVIQLLQQVRYVHANVARPDDWPEIEAVLRSQAK